MKLAIVGQGAISTLFSYYWRNYNPITLVKDVAPVNQRLSLLSGETVVLDAKTENVWSPQQTDFDYIFIAIKSYQVDALIRSIRPWLSTNTHLVLVQNGMGGADALADAFVDNTLFVGTTTDAAFKKQKGHFQMAAQGRLDLGIWPSSKRKEPAQIDPISFQLFNIHPQLVIHQNIKIALFQKLAVNAVINPTTALLNIKNGQLVNYPDLVSTLKSEINALYSAYFPLKYTVDEGELSANHLSVLIDKVIANTADNYSSMQQDVFYARQTEVDSVLGYLLREANKLDLAMPKIKELYEKIMTLYVDQEKAR